MGLLSEDQYKATLDEMQGIGEPLPLPPEFWPYCDAIDVAEQRVADAIVAGGTLVSAERARAFWVLADPEGNEACVCTWQDRD